MNLLLKSLFFFFVITGAAHAGQITVEGPGNQSISLHSLYATYSEEGYYGICSHYESIAGEVSQSKTKLNADLSFRSSVAGALFCGSVGLRDVTLAYRLRQQEFGVEYISDQRVSFTNFSAPAAATIPSLDVSCRNDESTISTNYDGMMSAYPDCKTTQDVKKMALYFKGRSKIQNFNVQQTSFPVRSASVDRLVYSQQIPDLNLEFRFYAEPGTSLRPLDLVEVKNIDDKKKSQFPAGIYRIKSLRLDKTSGVPVYFFTSFVTNKGKGQHLGFSVYLKGEQPNSPAKCDGGSGRQVLAKAVYKTTDSGYFDNKSLKYYCSAY